MAGVAIEDIYLGLAWQARQLCHIPSFSHQLTHTTLSHTIFYTPSHSHNFVTHHLSPIFLTTPSFTRHLTHTTLPHTIFLTDDFVTDYPSHTISLTRDCHRPSFTHHLSPHVTHHLSHTFDTPLCHPPSFTTPSYSHICHTTFSHNFVGQFFPHIFVQGSCF